MAADGSPRLRTLVFRGWPATGSPRLGDAAFAESWSEQAPTPEPLMVLSIAIRKLELLQLNGDPHRRLRWRELSGWEPEELNP